MLKVCVFVAWSSSDIEIGRWLIISSLLYLIAMEYWNLCFRKGNSWYIRSLKKMTTKSLVVDSKPLFKHNDDGQHSRRSCVLCFKVCIRRLGSHVVAFSGTPFHVELLRQNTIPTTSSFILIAWLSLPPTSIDSIQYTNFKAGFPAILRLVYN